MFVDAILGGLSIGSVLLISALGLAIVFGLMGVINMAHGELMMLGAYTTFVVQNLFKGFGDGVFELYIFAALVASFAVTALVGLGLERGVVRYLYGRPLETLLATWGISLMLQQLVRSVNGVLAIGLVLFSALCFGGLWVLSKRPNWQRIRVPAIATLLPVSAGVAIAAGAIAANVGKLTMTKPWFGAQNVAVTAPGWLRGGMAIANFQLPFTRLFIIGLTIACMAGLYWFLNRSTWGLRIRAVTQNRAMSSCLGIPTERVDALTFALGSGLAGLAGCGISLLGAVGPNTGQNYIVDTFMVVVVGGVGKLVGSVVAALMIGTANFLIGSGTFAVLFQSVPPLQEFFSFFATSSMAKVMVFSAIIVFLQVRPGGLFPQKGRSVDA